MLGNRLRACFEMVSEGGICCDVGTDHAYLPIELIETGRCRRAAACDINEMPLKAGLENARRHGVDDRIDFVLSDGLSKVDLSEVTDILIAGMGGELIYDIISRCAAVKRSGVRLILQPMTRAEALRRKLYENGFEIRCERAAEEREFTYSVMAAEYSGICRQPSVREEYLGGLLESVQTDIVYARTLLERERKIAAGLENSDAQSACTELCRHREIISVLEEFIGNND